MSFHLPDIKDIDLEPLAVKNFPSLIPYRILISDNAYNRLHNQISGDIEKEIGGVLVGNVFKDDMNAYLEIIGIIEAEQTISESTSLTFTQDTWVKINQTLSAQFPQQRIVGWYHSHPRHGVFLSSQDLFIHQNFFNHPWQTAFVADPVSGDEAFFVWDKGKVKPVPFFWVNERIHTSSLNSSVIKQKNQVPEIIGPPPVSKPSMHSSFAVGIITAVILIAVLTIFPTIILNSKIDVLVSKVNYLESLNRSVGAMDHEIQNTGELTGNIREALLQVPSLKNVAIKVSFQEGILCGYGEVYSPSQKQAIEDAVRLFTGASPVDLQNIRIVPYIIRKNDSLASIALRVYGNQGKWPVLYAANRQHIKDPDDIRENVPLVIP